MSKNQNHHLDDSPQIAANQKNQMSEDPRDGSRLTDKPEAIERTAAEKKPRQDRHDEATIEEFGERGMGVAAKE
ncbi:MAG TPA: hypothetical protein VNH53_10805 [Sphingomicrobium sp.]|jgi:hypothetical protein|nr:hypothetical protein [Sphingomicrobium sp.]